MEHGFFEDDEYYGSIEDYLSECFVSTIEELNETFEDDWFIDVELAELRPIFQFTPEHLMHLIQDFYEDDLPEDCDMSLTIIEEKLPTWFNFELANSQVPEAYYGTKKKVRITKDDLIDSL